MQSGSAGQAKQLVAAPALAGFREGLKWTREPAEETVVGRWAVEIAVGEQRSHRRRSISWQHFVSRDGAVVEAFRQFPLWMRKRQSPTSAGSW